MHKTNKLFLMSLLASTFLVPKQVSAQILPDVNINLNIPIVYTADYVALSVATPVNTVNLNLSNGTFKKSVYGNRLGIQNKSVINISGGTIEGDVVGLERNRFETGKILQSNTINVSGGIINGNVLATKDTSNYNGTDRRDSNNINFSGGGIGGRIEGGAGAANNVITVTGGTLEKTNDDHSHDDNYCDGDSGLGNDGNASGSCSSGTIYAGVSNATAKNQSTNGTVILKNMDDSNSFLSTFTDGPDDLSGMIFGSNLTGTSNMRFENVDGTYKGGFKNFDNMLVDVNSNLILGGTAYYADNWKIDGSLDTNGKIAHTYKNATLNLDVSGTGSLKQQFLSDANVNATNAGSIKGIKTDKNINLSNSGNMTGEYAGSTVNINNSGTINSVAGQSTTISSTNPGVLNNTGQIKETISFSGQTTVNNNTGGLIDAVIINAQNILNINNTGTIDSTTIANLNGTKTTNINNNSGGVIQNGLALTNGVLNLNNQLGGSLTGNPFTTKAGAFNISNSGNMSGTSSLTATDNGTFSFINNATGNVTGGLTINSGLGIFTNNGTFNSLGITNNQVGVVLNNNKDITGTGSILSDSNFSLNNNSGGNITGTQTWKNVTLDNKTGATVNNLALISDTGTVNIGNSGTYSGNNSFASVNGGTTNFNNLSGGLLSGSFNVLNGPLSLTNALGGSISNIAFNANNGLLGITNNGSMSGTNSISANNGGSVTLANGATGNLTGTLNTISGLSSFSNAGTLHDLTLNNQINNLTLTNTSTINGTNVINNAPGVAFDIQNNANGIISDTMNNTGGVLNIHNNTGGTVKDLTMLVSNNGVGIQLDNTGTIHGNNTANVTNGSGQIIINNNVGGEMTDTLNTINGATVNNTGLVDNLTINNSQNILNINNTSAGELRGTLTLNNSNSNVINLNNQSSDVLNGALALKNGTLNLNNFSGSTINGYAMTVDSAVLNLENEGTIAGSNSITNTNGGTASLTNYTGGVLGGNFGVIGGSMNLQNLNNATISGLDLKADNSTINIQNTGSIEGTNTLENATNGIIHLANKIGGTIKDILNIKGGVETFDNEGLIADLTLNNSQATLDIDNSGLISGTNNFNNTGAQTITLTNKTGGQITGELNSVNGVFNLNNKAGALIQGLDYSNADAVATIGNEGIMNGHNSLQTSGTGSLTFANLAGGLLSGQLDVLSAIEPVSNAGTISGLNLYNTAASALVLNNTGLITGTDAFKDVNLNNQTGGFIQNANITSDAGLLVIANNGTINGTNTLDSLNGGTITFDNNNGGNVTGNLTINGGLNNINNNVGGTIGDLNLDANVNIFSLTNTGSIIGNNTLMADNEVKIINNGAGIVNSNLTINAPITTLEQHSSGDFLANLYGNSSTNTLNLINSTLLNSSLNGDIGTVNLTNDNPSNVTASLTLTNNGTIHNNINVDNESYTKINNNGTILAALSDASSPIVADTACPTNTLELNNSGNISGDMSVLNNIFKFNNTGNVTSDKIDTRDLRLTNAGSINSANNYAFSVRGNVEANNAASGVIYGKDYAFKLLGQPVAGSDVKGFIDNYGTIYSQGTTIGYDQSNIPCPSCYGSDLVINNYGHLVSVDVATLTNPDLNSHAISAENAVVNNYAGGLIGGSTHVKEYNQKAGATWITFLDKDLSKMSTIIAEDKISIEAGSILTIYTNNNVKAFTDNQEFKLVEAKGMNQNAIDAEIENFTIRTDSPFANYQMIGKNNDEGYLVFNHVAPTTFANSTDLATASHNTTILGSQRMYELFANRDVNQIQGLASGDSFNTTNKLNFMPIGGYAHQSDKDGHAGYDTNYYGGMGYWEHDFNNNFKGGLGFAYMNNSTDFNDADDSDGNIDSYRPFAYINYENGPWRVDLAGGVAKHKVDNNRKYSFNDVRYNAEGKYDADEISGHLNIGYKMNLENDIVVQPMIGAYAAKLKTDAFDEKGSGPMNMHVESEDYNSLKSMVGMKLSKEYKLDNGGSLKPELHVRWYHELGDTKGGVSAYFLAQEQLFNTSGIESPKDVGDIALRLTTKTGEDFDLFTEAYYQFGSKFYNVGGTVGLQYNF